MKRPAKHLLIVDDNPTLRKLLAEILQAEGYTTSEASDGAEALDLLEKTKVDAIISDILMSGMDGYRFCYEVRRSRKHSTLPFIFLTAAYTSPNDGQHALDLGADKILRKPFSATEILNVLHEMFDNPLYQKPRAIKPIKEVEVIKQYTDRLVKKLEEKIGELQERTEEYQKFSNALEQIADSVVITNKEGVIEYVNPAFEQTTGYTKEFAIGKTPAILKSGRQDAVFYEKLWKTILSGKVFREEFINRKSNGELYHEQQAISPVFDTDGKIVHFVSAGRDVTEQKRAEEQLRSIHARLQGLIDHSPAVIYTMKIEQGRVLPYVASENIVQLLGFTADESKSFEWWATHLHPDDKAGAYASIEETLQRETLTCEYRLRHKNDEYIWVEDSRRVLRDQAGRSQEIIGVWTDITGRKRADDQIRKLSRVYAVLSNINQAIVRIHDPQQLFNEACRIAVEVGHFQMAWIGTLNRETQRVDIIASAGTTNDYLSTVDIDLNDEKKSEGLTGSAIATRTHVILNDVENDDAMRPWRNDLRALGIRSSAAFPLEVFGKVWGVFDLYSSDVGFFDADEIKLLDELSKDLSFAIEFIQQEADRKRAEGALEDSERKYKLLFVANPHPMWFFDPKTLAFLDVNEAATRHYGYSRQEFLSMTIKDIRPPDEVARMLEVVAEAHDGLNLSGQWKHKKKDGTIIQVEVTSHEIDYSGRKAKVVLAHDITARKLALENLVQSEKKYRTLFEESMDGLFISTPGGKILDANSALVEMMGYDSKEEVLALDVTKDIYANESERERLLKMLESEDFVENFEAVEKKKDGQKINVLLNVTAQRDTEGNIVTIRGLTRDVTEQRKLEQQFFRAQRMESIGTLAGGIAHDLNNVLAPITMGVEMLKSRIKDEGSQKILRTMEVSAHRGSGMIKQVLTFARGVSVERVVLQIGHLIREMQKIMAETFPKSIQFRTKVANNLWPVSADATQIHQVLLNLCVNARDAMPDGGFLTIAAENVVLDKNSIPKSIESKSGPYVYLTVTDTGTGIPQRLIDKVFDPFYTTKEIGKGTGLGLSTVHSIVKNHGGFINLYSEMGKGTKFSVYLPAEPDAEEKKLEVEIEIPSGQGEFILLIDDEASIREMCKTMLVTYGYNVFTASDGTEAVLLYLEHTKDIKIVITDMMMPFMDGRATIKALRKINPYLKIIATSGFMGQEKSIDLSDLPVYAFLAKPYTASKLLIAVSQALATGKKL